MRIISDTHYSMIDIIARDKRLIRYVPDVKKTAEAVLRLIGEPSACVEIALVSQRDIHSLNAMLRGHDKPTNVLSFPIADDFVSEEKGMCMGEIYISPAFVRQHGQSLGHMVVHGILHLWGFDHETKRDRIEMEQVEKEICSLLCLDCS